jgi:hypothetical protein
MDSENASMKPRIPTELDRYPAKMVSHLAKRLIEKYAVGCQNLLDPFCGSGAILAAGSRFGLPVTGFDVNPYAVLLSNVKLRGFSPEEAERLRQRLFDLAARGSRSLPIAWDAKDYWFSRATLLKYEQLRYAAREIGLNKSQAGMAVLLALALSVRLCSRADQRSPKPFISKRALRERRGKHYDPYHQIKRLLGELASLYGKERDEACKGAFCVDLTAAQDLPKCLHGYSHVITSPPYLNAQDYYRNFKLELRVLEGIIPFTVNDLQYRFLGTERGKLMADISSAEVDEHHELVPELRKLSRASPRHAAVVHRYFHDMGIAIKTISNLMKRTGTCVIVCGDNLVDGVHIRTWQALNALMEHNGFSLYDSFSDTIHNRMVPPMRQGHKGLIKQEYISAFRRP